MKKKVLVIVSVIVLMIIITLLVLPKIVIYGENKVTFISYNDDFSRFDQNHCYDESYAYYEDLDISIYNFDVEKKLFLYFITLEYEEGNVCETEYLLEESYIQNYIENAIIEENEQNIDIAALIEGKEAIVGNTRYSGNEYRDAIYYILDGKYEEMYIFYVDDLLVIQVGNSDEGPKFIAYK